MRYRTRRETVSVTPPELMMLLTLVAIVASSVGAGLVWWLA
jgi:hypothetical protein